MIKDREGNRISPRKKAKEIVVNYLDCALIDFYEDRDDGYFNGMTDLEMLRLEDALKTLIKAIVKRHRLF